MRRQAIRRSPRYMAMRTWWRAVDLQTQGDAAFGALVLVGFFLFGQLLDMAVKS